MGRVQTPTLAMLAERELAIRKFVSEDYLEIVASFCPIEGKTDNTYAGSWFRKRQEDGADKESLQEAMRLPSDGEEAKRIVQRAHSGKASVESIESETQRMAPLPLYDLTELQRHANRLFGFSAQKTLDLAQALYERHKLLSYPRTDSRYLAQDVVATLPGIVKAIEAPYRDHLAPRTGERQLGRRFIDDARVTDHHAIIPTATSPSKAALTVDERKIYDLICRRLLGAWHDDYIWSVTTVITSIANSDIIDRYHTSGTTVEQAGWKVMERPAEKSMRKASAGVEDQRSAEILPPDLQKGQLQRVVEIDAVKKSTRPPRRFTEATLLTAMETAGKTLEEKELSLRASKITCGRSWAKSGNRLSPQGLSGPARPQLRHGPKFSRNRQMRQCHSRAIRCRASCRTPSDFPRFVQTRKRFVALWLRAKMPCWLCRLDPASRCASSCPGSRAEGQRSSSVRSSR